MKSGMIGCEIFLTQTLRLTQDDIFLETKFREHKKNTLISSQMISHGNEWECTGSIMQIPTTYIKLRP